MAKISLKAEAIYLGGPEHLAFKIADVMKQERGPIPSPSIVVHAFRIVDPPPGVYLEVGEAYVEAEYVETSCGFVVL